MDKTQKKPVPAPQKLKSLADKTTGKKGNASGAAAPLKKKGIDLNPNENSELHHPHLHEDEKFPQRGNTDPYKGESWVY